MARKPDRVRSVSSCGDDYWVDGRRVTRAQWRRAWAILYPTGSRWPVPKGASHRRRKQALDGRRALKGCEHDFEYREDWEGDPGVINGTHTICWLECMHCGTERPGSYEDAPSYDDYDY